MHHPVAGLLVLVVVFGVLERWWAIRPQRRLRRGIGTDLVHFAVTGLLSTGGFLVLITPVVIAARHGLGLPTAGPIHAQPVALQVVEALLIAELAHYWAHRAAHRVPLLWRFHAVHHSIAELDWIASARLHPADAAVERTLTLAPLVLLGFSHVTVGGLAAFQVFAALFQHANVRANLGPLRWIVSTPQMHHWHHSRELATSNTNFAGSLPLLDLLFGTALVRRDWPEAYGVEGGAPASGYVRQLAHPWARSDRSLTAPGAAVPAT